MDKRPMTAGQMRAAAGVPETYPPEPAQARPAAPPAALNAVLSELEGSTPATLEAAVRNAIGMLRRLAASPGARHDVPGVPEPDQRTPHTFNRVDPNPWPDE